MHLKVVIFSGILLFVVSSAPRKYEDSGSSSYVMIGNSNESYKKLENDDKKIRSGYSHNMMMNHRPSSDYHTGYNTGGYGSSGSPYHSQSSLISANVQLLEPFMLVTFLLFVLSLIEKSKIPHQLSRNDYVQELLEPHNNYTNADSISADYYRRNNFLKILMKANETNF